MKVTINPDECSGCGLCADICPEVFDMDGDLAVVKTQEVPEDLEDAVREAAECCCTEGIKIEE